MTGYIPLYAAGTLYRNGPGSRELFNEQGDSRYRVSHWFDGFSQLHKFDLVPRENGIQKVVYSSRFQVDSLMEDLVKTGNYTGYTFGQKRDPCAGIFRKICALFVPTPYATPSNTNVPVTVSANFTGFPISNLTSNTSSKGHKSEIVTHLVVRTDEGRLKALDPQTLQPIGVAHQSCLHPLLRGPLSASHAKSDPETGDVFNYNLDLGKDAVYRVFKTSASTGETEILATIRGQGIAPAYMHSFFLSQNFVIICVWSAHLLAGGIRVLWEKNVLDAIAPFDKSKKSKWFVVDRRNGKGVVGYFESSAAFCFHTVNAFEVTSSQGPNSVDVMCDLIEHDNLDVLHKFYYENLRASSPAAARWMAEREPACAHRFVQYKLEALPLDAHSAVLSKKQREHHSPLPPYRSVEVVSSIGPESAGDMPTINHNYACRPYRYFWCCNFSTSRSTFIDGLTKVDKFTKTSLRWDNPPSHTPGEAIFIPAPNATEEDDGVLLTVVLDGFKGTSYLLCLDARNMQELGRADCQGPLPFMFHGQHLSSTGKRPLDV